MRNKLPLSRLVINLMQEFHNKHSRLLVLLGKKRTAETRFGGYICFCPFRDEVSIKSNLYVEYNALALPKLGRVCYLSLSTLKWITVGLYATMCARNADCTYLVSFI